MMFMISGRATNANGSPIVRDGVVAAIHAAGHSVVTAQPRRGSYAYVDFLVATRDSINRRVTKVRWAAERSIAVIDYAQMWSYLDHGVVPNAQVLPPEAAERLPSRVTMADVHRQEAVERRNRQDEDDLDALRQRQRIQEMEAAEAQALDSAGTYNSETETAHPRPAPAKRVVPAAAPARPPRRKIVTRR